MEATETKDAAKALTAEFEVDGKTLIYDFDELRMAQMKLAEAVYGYQADLEKRPPRSLREKIELGGADYDQVVLSYILLLRQSDGSLQRFKGGETQRVILELVNNLPAKYADLADKVIMDFFARRGRYTLALLVRSKYEMLYAERLSSRLMAIQAAQTMTSEESSPSADAVNTDSTTQESGSADSENA